MGIYWRWLLYARTSFVLDVLNFETTAEVSWCNLVVYAIWELRPGNDSGCFESMPEKEETLTSVALVNLNRGIDTL